MSRIFIVLVFAMALWGCKSDSAIEVMKDGASIEMIKDKARLTAIKQAFEQKSEVVFKKRPNFEYVIKVKDGDTLTEWEYSSIGAITSKQDGATIYKVDLKPSQFLNK